MPHKTGIAECPSKLKENIVSGCSIVGQSKKFFLRFYWSYFFSPSQGQILSNLCHATKQGKASKRPLNEQR